MAIPEWTDTERAALTEIQRRIVAYWQSEFAMSCLAG